MNMSSKGDSFTDPSKDHNLKSTGRVNVNQNFNKYGFDSEDFIKGRN